MKVFFVVDTETSALHTSACQWAKKLGGTTLVASDFSSFGSLLKNLIVNAPDVVVFSWRQVLDLAFLSRENLKKLEHLVTQTRVLALIADHTSNDPERMARDARLLQANVGLVPVSQRLFDQYSNLGMNPIGILPDMPNVDLIREIRSQHIPKEVDSVIWVGNSAWGKRQGYVDHKGLRSKFEPFLRLADQSNLRLKSLTIDSSSKRVNQGEVLRSLAGSELLIVTSHSEGTGLPILEALGVGTNVLSTDVGISNLLSAVRVLPIDSAPKDYLDSYLKWRNNKFTPQECISVFEKYLIYVNHQWETLQKKLLKGPNQSQILNEPREGGNQRLIHLLFWNLKFFLRWVQKRYAK